jgi:hypothetical protein
MFGWFRPKCPLNPPAKDWVEERLAWLSDEFGFEPFIESPVILPTSEFFPDTYDGSKPTVRKLLNRTCRYMGVSPRLVAMKLYSEANRVWLVDGNGEYLPGTAGLYEEGEERFIIRLERSQLSNPMDLVGTMAHELAHVRLLGESRISNDAPDNELVTDLTVVFHGLGIFMANSPRAFRSTMRKWGNSDALMPEYLSLPMLVYALAHQSWWRGERKPAWLGHLRPDARAAFKPALRYLWETRDSQFRPR